MHDRHRRSQTRRASRSWLTRKQGSGVSPERDRDRVPGRRSRQVRRLRSNSLDMRQKRAFTLSALPTVLLYFAGYLLLCQGARALWRRLP